MSPRSWPAGAAAALCAITRRRRRPREILTIVTDDHPPAPGQRPGTEARVPGPDVGGPGPDIEAEWSRAVKILGGATEICLACHVRPDGDALGSMLAVAHALRARGTAVQGVPAEPDGTARPDRTAERAPSGARVIASFGDLPFEIPRILRFLPGADLLSPPDAFPERPQVMVTFDAASMDRLGILEPRAYQADELIVLDHHASNTRFGTVNLVDPAAAATAVLAFDLIRRMGVEISRDIALGLYAGLVTDTGSFKYSTTSPGVHELAARLLQTGIEPGKVAHELWDRSPFGFLGLLSTVLGRAQLEPAAASGHGLVWTTVTRGDRAAHGLPFEAAESVIDVVRRADEADVAVVLKEDDDGCWQVSTRSKGRADVGRACVALGGGGHPLAAGFTAHGTAAEVMTALREQLATGPAGLGVPSAPGGPGTGRR
jgi:bifunctional oligoribonuclease and PAP phosphatase NrnA